MGLRSKKRQPKAATLLAFVSIVMLTLSACAAVSPPAPDQSERRAPLPPPTTTSSAAAAVSIDAIPSEGLYSPHAILVRLADRMILMQKGAEERIYPASLTKMMTALVAIENLPDLQQSITLPAAMFHDLFDADAMMAGFAPNEEVRAVDLLYGAMLPSGAEACIGLAGFIAGSEQAFVAMMNQKAADLGMAGTHFTNTTGLHDEEHYTTVRDLAVLLVSALENDRFRTIFTTARHSTRFTNAHPGGITFYSTLFEKLGNPGVFGGEILGGKTGYTDEAGLCLASLAIIDGQEYILVTAGARGNHTTEQFNISDALAVYNSLGGTP